MLIGPGMWINRGCAADNVAGTSKGIKEFCKFFFERKGTLGVFCFSWADLEAICFCAGHLALNLDSQIVKVNVIPAQAA